MKRVLAIALFFGALAFVSYKAYDAERREPKVVFELILGYSSSFQGTYSFALYSDCILSVKKGTRRNDDYANLSFYGPDEAETRLMQADYNKLLSKAEYVFEYLNSRNVGHGFDGKFFALNYADQSTFSILPIDDYEVQEWTKDLIMLSPIAVEWIRD